MFLLVPAHPGFPGQIPQSHKTVVCVCINTLHQPLRKTTIESKLAQSIKDNKKSFYANVQSKSKTRTKTRPLTGDNSGTVVDSSARADSFSKYFFGLHS